MSMVLPWYGWCIFQLLGVGLSKLVEATASQYTVSAVVAHKVRQQVLKTKLLCRAPTLLHSSNQRTTQSWWHGCGCVMWLHCLNVHLSCDDILKFDWCCQLPVNLISLVSRLVWWLSVSCAYYKYSGDSAEAGIERLQYMWLNNSVWQESIVLNGSWREVGV